MGDRCPHGEVELLGEEKTSRGFNRYYRCLKCGSVLVLSDDGVLYEVPGIRGIKKPGGSARPEGRPKA